MSHGDGRRIASVGRRLRHRRHGVTGRTTLVAEFEMEKAASMTDGRVSWYDDGRENDDVDMRI